MDFIAALNSINQTKENLIRTSDSPDQAEKQYPMWPVQKMLAHFPDTVLWVNELNCRGAPSYGVTNRQHYEFLLTAIEPRKRFSSFIKPDKESELLSIVKKVNRVSDKKAIEIIDLLSKEQVEAYLALEEGGTDSASKTKKKNETGDEAKSRRRGRRFEDSDKGPDLGRSD